MTGPVGIAASTGDRRRLVGMTTRTPAGLLMQREMRVRYGSVPRSLSGEPLCEMSWQLAGDTFLLRGEGHHYFHYSRGRGVTVERGPDADLSEESLWLNGSVYAAVASLNGLLPIHASAVAHDGGVFAFTGPAGSGKSTLVAALASQGLPLFCDDTLVLDLSDPERIICLPGHKRLKLCSDAVELTGASPEEKVSAAVNKFYAKPQSAHTDGTLPLRELIFLEQGRDPTIEPIRGAERMVRMQDEHYTAAYFAQAQRLDRAANFSHLSRLGRQISMARFVREFDAAQFQRGVALVAHYIRTGEGPR